jgi:hypothetical protein
VERLEAKRNRSRLVLLLMVMWSLLPLQIAWSASAGTPLSEQWPVRGFEALGFGAASIWVVRKLLDTRPAIVLSPEGLLDNAGGIGLIPWTEITGLRELSPTGSEWIHPRFLSVDVPDRERYIRRLPLVGRLLRQLDYQAYGTPLVIRLDQLDVSPEVLIAACKQYLEEYGQMENRSSPRTQPESTG